MGPGNVDEEVRKALRTARRCRISFRILVSDGRHSYTCSSC
jgi:hypothetical protein